MNYIPNELKTLLYMNRHKLLLNNNNSKLVGFINNNNMCYLNSIVQILLNIDELKIFFSDISFCIFLTNYIKKNLLKNFNNNYTLIFSILPKTTSFHIFNIFNIYFKRKNNNNINLKNIKNILAHYNDMYDDNSQQDASETLNFILDRIHIEQERKIIIDINYDYINNNHIIINGLNYIKNSYSIITKIFTTIYNNTSTCPLCNYTSNRIEINNILDLELYVNIDKINKLLSSNPNINENKKKIITNTLLLKMKTSLDDCLNNFIKDEILDDANKLLCSNCNNYVNAIKKINIIIPPIILIISIKKYNGNNKKKNLVHFPLYNFHINQYMNTDVKYIKDYYYDLIGIVNQIGDINYGHYFSFLKQNNEWFCVNDERISKINEDDVITNNAYMLFYHLK